MSPKLSVIFPTRNRPSLLPMIIESVERGWGSVMDIEFCIKLDPDDTASLETLQELNKSNLKTIITPRGRGYLDLPIFFNDLVQASTGNFIVPWNDDAYLEDPGDVLDYMLKTPPNPLKERAPLMITSDITCNFPIFHSDLLQTFAEMYGKEGMGVFTNVFHIDGYMHQLCQNVPALRWKENSTYVYSHISYRKNERVNEMIRMPGIFESWLEVEEQRQYLFNHTPFDPTVNIYETRFLRDSEHFKKIYNVTG